MDARQAAWVGATLRAGFRALNAGDAATATRHCRALLGRFPRTVPAHFLVGLIALDTEDRRTAVSAFGSVTHLDPTHAAAWAQLSRLFVLSGQANRADRALGEAVRHGSRDPLVQDVVGTVYSLLGDQESARRWYAKAVRNDPDAVQPRVNLASSLVFLGDARAAVRELETVLRSNPHHPQAHWLLASARRAEDRRHVETMARLAEERRLPPRAAAFLHYAIGKELEDLEDWDGAFEAFDRGAAAKRRIVRYDEAAEAEAFRAARDAFTAEWFDDGPRGVTDRSPIFVVGQPRTGTTLVERIIASHSWVHSAGELQQFALSIRRLTGDASEGRFNAAFVRSAASVDAKALGEEYLRATRKARGTARRFVDKLPVNYFHLPLIARAFPNARIVHLVRDPRDACFASFKQLFANAYLHSYEQRETARHFVRYHRLMATWRSRFADRFIDVVYEDLVKDLETEARALIDDLGLPWEDDCLRFHEHAGAVATASAVQVREPAHTRSVGRWRRYAARLQPTIDVLNGAGLA